MTEKVKGDAQKATGAQEVGIFLFFNEILSIL